MTIFDDMVNAAVAANSLLDQQEAVLILTAARSALPDGVLVDNQGVMWRQEVEAERCPANGDRLLILGLGCPHGAEHVPDTFRLVRVEEP